MSDEDNQAGGKLEKLIATKQKWAREGRLLTGEEHASRERLPPGQREVETWPVLDLGIKPKIALGEWKLTIDGLVANKTVLDWSAFTALPQREFISDVHCVTAWSRYDNRWQGVGVHDLLDLVKPLPAARHVIFHSYDGYTTNLALEVFADEDVLLATHWEGAPLTLDHGGPVRVVVPKKYFWKSAKWIARIEFSPQDKPGFWETRGYHNEGDPWEEERYSW
jgi:DMSO/TMAO reductase YedYZ molybdopterin-dependent catalytic subunit